MYMRKGCGIAILILLFFMPTLTLCQSQQIIWHRITSMDNALTTDFSRQLSAHSKTSCGQHCLLEDACQAFTFSPGQRLCFLHSSRSPSAGTSESGAVSFQKKLAECPAGWTPSATATCFKVISAGAIWHDAKQSCASDDGQLATAGTAEDRAALVLFAGFHVSSDSWIGAKDFGTGNVEWLGGQGTVDGSLIHSGDGDCLVISFNNHNYLRDHCHSSRPYVCQITL